MAETWRTVPGWPAYSVSDQGRVQGPSGKMLKAAPVRAKGTDRITCLLVDLSTRGVRTTRKVHHLVLEAFVGPKPPGMECRHGDGDPTNNRLGNLCWGTRLENVSDWKRHGRPGTKLSEEEVAEIRSCWAMRKTKKVRQVDLAQRYGTSQSHISSIVNWRWWV
jgi:hypothetical protein